jgi:hypothetical protein
LDGTVDAADDTVNDANVEGSDATTDGDLDAPGEEAGLGGDGSKGPLNDGDVDASTDVTVPSDGPIGSERPVPSDDAGQEGSSSSASACACSSTGTGPGFSSLAALFGPAAVAAGIRRRRGRGSRSKHGA